jgi:hypothetical protein
MMTKPIIGLLIILSFSLGHVNAAPVELIDRPLPAGLDNLAEIQAFLVSTLESQGWRSRASDRALVATRTDNRRQSATIRLSFSETDKTFSLSHIRSTDEGVYNQWANELQSTLSGNRTTAAATRAPAATGVGRSLLRGLGEAVDSIGREVTQAITGAPAQPDRSESANEGTPAPSRHESATQAPETLATGVPPRRNWDDKKRIAILPIQTTTAALTADEADYITDLAQGALVRTDYFDVMEQREIKRLLETQQLQATDLYDNDDLVSQYGQLLRVSVLIMGRVGRFDRSYSINLRMIEVDTSRILSTRAVHFEGGKGALLEQAERVANDLAHEYYRERQRSTHQSKR